MEYLKKTILPILLAGIWINISETLRWEFLIKAYWIEKYQEMAVTFPEEPINMVVWMVWGFLLAIVVFIISKKFKLLQATFITWFMIFIMFWIVIWNMGILPLDMLGYVVPLSLFEIYIAVIICKRLS